MASIVMHVRNENWYTPAQLRDEILHFLTQQYGADEEFDSGPPIQITVTVEAK